MNFIANRTTIPAGKLKQWASLTLVYKGKWPMAKDLFMSILPVSAAIISYWFAGRKPKNETPDNEQGKGQDK